MNENPFDQMVSLQNEQEKAADAARQVLGEAGFEVHRMALVCQVTHSSLSGPMSGEKLNMAVFHPYEDWGGHLRLMSEGLEVARQESVAATVMDLVQGAFDSAFAKLGGEESAENGEQSSPDAA